MDLANGQEAQEKDASRYWKALGLHLPDVAKSELSDFMVTAQKMLEMRTYTTLQLLMKVFTMQIYCKKFWIVC